MLSWDTSVREIWDLMLCILICTKHLQALMVAVAQVQDLKVCQRNWQHFCQSHLIIAKVKKMGSTMMQKIQSGELNHITVTLELISELIRIFVRWALEGWSKQAKMLSLMRIISCGNLANIMNYLIQYIVSMNLCYLVVNKRSLVYERLM